MIKNLVAATAALLAVWPAIVRAGSVAAGVAHSAVVKTVDNTVVTPVSGARTGAPLSYALTP